ncbi:hypothetical protein SG34_004585 [Thalassomonas viridans]|uniref:Uncharacterized protein n=1 Tax=Thalassomonas viridans TaxID=137584 RepID=A0AAE9Z6W7_9GAMM|nr:hypothetical protein [Thalassomonas viridans]WDE06212.1 hypothetical protein SG34_004585 [Thalassomonas viridans]
MTIITPFPRAERRRIEKAIRNDNTVRQWRAHRYYQAFDYICTWAGVKSNIMCAGGGSVVLRDSGPVMVYYYGSDAGKKCRVTAKKYMTHIPSQNLINYQACMYSHKIA